MSGFIPTCPEYARESGVEGVEWLAVSEVEWFIMSEVEWFIMSRVEWFTMSRVEWLKWIEPLDTLVFKGKG